MKKILIFFFVLACGLTTFAQSEVKQIGDTVRVVKRTAGDAIFDVKGVIQASNLPSGTTLDSIVLWDPTLKRFKKTTRADINYHNHSISQVTGLFDALAGKQSLLGYTPENAANRGIANGYAPLGTDGRISSSFLPFSTMIFKDAWNANTNTPTLANGTGTAGWYYVCYFAGTANLGGGSVSYNVGDQLVYNGTIWKQIPSSVSVSSVNGFTGTVVLTTNNIAESGTNYYWTTARTRNAIGITTTGNSGLATYDASSGIYNIPHYTLSGLGGEPSILSGTTLQYWRGDKTWATLNSDVVPEGSTNKYYTDVRVSANTDVAANTAARHAAVSIGVGNGLTISGQAISMGLSGASTNGSLSSTDWNTFNNKQAALGFTPYPASNPNNYISSYTENDPTISAWAKASTKPVYAYSEITGTPTLPTLSSMGAIAKADSLSGGYLTWALGKKKVDSLGAIFDKAFVSSSFDTLTRNLTLTPTSGSPFVINIPRGSASGATGISALSATRTGNLVKIMGDNGSYALFSSNDSDSLTRAHLGDTLTNGFTTWALTKKKIDSLGAAKLDYRTFGTAANNNTGDFVAARTFGTAANNNTGDFTASNTAITAGTKTKITYDAKGLVTAGADATTADIAASTNKNYVTDAQLTVIGNTSGTNTGDQTLSGLGGVPTTRQVNGHALSADVTVTKSDVGLGSVENTALSTWAGSANITTLGTITSGIWHGTAISDTYISSAATWNAKQAALNGLGIVRVNATTVSYDYKTYAYDSLVVHNSGSETIAGTKTFSSIIGGSITGNSATTSQTNFSALTVASVAVVVTTDSRLSDSRNAADVYAWAKASTKPTYAYSEITGTPTIPVVYAWALAATKPSYIYSEIGGTVPTWNQNTTGTAYNITQYTINQSVGTSSSPTFEAINVTQGVFNRSSSVGGTSASGAVVVENLSSGNAVLDIGVDATLLGFIQSRNISSNTNYTLNLNPNGGTVSVGAGLTTASGLSVSGYGTLGNSANKFLVDFYSGNTRFYSLGTNTTTRGGYQFHNASSNGSLDDITLSISDLGALNITQGIWHTSGGYNRFYFDASSTYISSPSAWNFQNYLGQNVVSINSAGTITGLSSMMLYGISGNMLNFQYNTQPIITLFENSSVYGLYNNTTGTNGITFSNTNNNATLAGALLWASDGTYSIGSSGGGRPQNIYLAGAIGVNATIGENGTITASSGFYSTTTADVVTSATAGTTSRKYHNLTSTGANGFWGIESSTGGSLITGGSAYATILASGGGTNLQLGTNNNVRLNFDGTTGAITSYVSITATQFASTVQTLTDGATVTFNANNGSNAVVTLAGNRTLAFSNTIAGTYYTLKVIQDATGSRTLTLPSDCKVIGGGSGAITLSTAAGSLDLITFYYDGTYYYVTYGTNYN